MISDFMNIHATLIYLNNKLIPNIVVLEENWYYFLNCTKLFINKQDDYNERVKIKIIYYFFDNYFFFNPTKNLDTQSTIPVVARC